MWMFFFWSCVFSRYLHIYIIFSFVNAQPHPQSLPYCWIDTKNSPLPLCSLSHWINYCVHIFLLRTISLSLSLSLSHTHTCTHTLPQSPCLIPLCSTGVWNWGQCLWFVRLQWCRQTVWAANEGVYQESGWHDDLWPGHHCPGLHARYTHIYVPSGSYNIPRLGFKSHSYI